MLIFKARKGIPYPTLKSKADNLTSQISGQEEAESSQAIGVNSRGHRRLYRTTAELNTSSKTTENFMRTRRKATISISVENAAEAYLKKMWANPKSARKIMPRSTLHQDSHHEARRGVIDPRA
ncbi:hypothetical protein R1flu_028343 [Riccia fluitans]|uniref:Uncharacterized protein n=1 Tax=Riccia fluitans TaxID=41844 RepID=A0ABD1XLE0_9MARC